MRELRERLNTAAFESRRRLASTRRSRRAGLSVFRLVDDPNPLLRPSLRVLVVDDCPVQQVATWTLLLGWGIAPQIAHHGGEAVRLATQQEFDIILMGIDLRGLDGLTAISRIRRLEQENPRRKRVAVVAYTASALGSDEALLRQCGIDDVLRKPCDSDAMRGCLQRWCSNMLATSLLSANA